MNKLQLFVYPAVAALSLAAALPALAEGPVGLDVSAQSAASPRTRAEVQGEVLQARARGIFTNGGTNFDPLAFVPRSTQPRALVVMQPRSARADELAKALSGEDSGSFYLSQHPAALVASRTLAGN